MSNSSCGGGSGTMRQDILDHLLALGRGIEAIILAHLTQLGDLGGFQLLTQGLLDGRRQFFIHNLLDILGNDILNLLLGGNGGGRSSHRSIGGLFLGCQFAPHLSEPLGDITKLHLGRLLLDRITRLGTKGQIRTHHLPLLARRIGPPQLSIKDTLSKLVELVWIHRELLGNLGQEEVVMLLDNLLNRAVHVSFSFLSILSIHFSFIFYFYRNRCLPIHLLGSFDKNGFPAVLRAR